MEAHGSLSTSKDSLKGIFIRMVQMVALIVTILSGTMNCGIALPRIKKMVLRYESLLLVES